MQVRRAALAAVHSMETLKRIREALTKRVQNTDSTPLSPGDSVDFWVIPDSKQGIRNGYWLCKCLVVSATGASTKMYIIRKPNQQLQEVHRNRLRLNVEQDWVPVPLAPLQDSNAPGPPGTHFYLKVPIPTPFHKTEAIFGKMSMTC